MLFEKILIEIFRIQDFFIFSAWIFISIIAGFTVGNYLVAWKSWGKLTRRDGECCD